MSSLNSYQTNRPGALTASLTAGWSFVEIVIVVVVMGVVASIALPRMSRGAGKPDMTGVISDLAIMRSAIKLYATEHHGQTPTLENFSEQLILYSDESGKTSPIRGDGYVFGPYLHAIPVQKVGPNKGSNALTANLGIPGFGWVYDESTGTITINAPSNWRDAQGRLLSSY